MKPCLISPPADAVCSKPLLLLAYMYAKSRRDHPSGRTRRASGNSQATANLQADHRCRPGTRQPDHRGEPLGSSFERSRREGYGHRLRRFAPPDRRQGKPGPKSAPRDRVRAVLPGPADGLGSLSRRLDGFGRYCGLSPSASAMRWL